MSTARQTAVIAVSLLIPFAGCGHKTKAVPQQAQAPIPPPSAMAHTPSLPPLPPPNPPNVTLASAQETSPPAHQHRPTRHKPSPSKSSNTAESAAPTEKPASSQQTQVAASGVTPDVSPIGQLTSAGDSTNIQQRHDIEQLINNTETGLNRIGRPLSSGEQETATQIKTFLTKAKQALVNNDLDGAHTLATKAKVLLDELTKK